MAALRAGLTARFPGLPVLAWCGPVIDQWRRAGLLEVRGDLLCLTRAGEFWQTTLAQSLIELCHCRAARESAAAR